jgi:hypothetical protein
MATVGRRNIELPLPAGFTITAANVANLRLKWAFGFADATAMRSQPVVVGNRVFVGSPDGRV